MEELRYLLLPLQGVALYVTTTRDRFLSEAQGHVGGWVDVVSNALPDGTTVWVNDEGLLLGLDGNAWATLLFRRYLAGNLVVTGGVDEDGNTLSVNPALVAAVGKIITVWEVFSQLPIES